MIRAHTLVALLLGPASALLGQSTSSVTYPPRPPMRRRIADPRVPVASYNGTVLRWHLEKRDSTAAVSDVVQPIVYRLDMNALPHRLIPWIRRGIEEWNPVFESIGFRHALVVREQYGAAPSAPPGPATGCLVTWGNQYGGEAATAGGDADEATGEKLGNGCFLMFGDVLIPDRELSYFTGTGGQPAGVQLQLPDSLLGVIIESIVAHEVGHSLGLPHNFRGAMIYPVDSMRNAGFVHRHGFTGSVESYGLFNYVAQPEDHIPPKDLIRNIGAGDRWALHWAYAPIPGAATPEDELPTLERWRAAQDTESDLRADIPALFGKDPTQRRGGRIVGGEPVKGATYGIRNLGRAIPLIESQKDTTLSLNLPDALRTKIVGQWTEWMHGVIDVLGGVSLQGPIPKDPNEAPTVPIDSVHQTEALRFVLDHLFRGRDPVIQAVTGVTPTDTTLVLFDHVTGQWNAAPWRDTQVSLLAALTGRLADVQAQAGATHVLPEACKELSKLRTSIHQAAADTIGGAPIHEQVQQLASLLASSPCS